MNFFRRTALAESELEYNESHKSSSIFVQFKIENFPNLGIPADKSLVFIDLSISS